jgi:DNA-directed RNA polymerase subunit F
MVRKISEEKPIPLGQVYELLQIREEAGINYVQRVTAQHAEKLSRNAAYSEEVLESLQKEFELSRLIAVQLVNINPTKASDVKAVVGERLTDDQIEVLLERYSEFVTKLLAAMPPSKETGEDETPELESDTGEEFEDL